MAGIIHGTAVVIGQRLVPQGASEVSWFAPVLDHVTDLTGVVVTADTLHTTRDHARYVTRRGGHYVFTAPRAMASLRNRAISALRPSGATDIAQALRTMARDSTRPLTQLGIPHPTSTNRL